MTKRDKIIAKINGLKAMAEHPSTEPALVEAAIGKYQALMEEYNLTLSDLDIAKSDIGSFRKSEKGKAQKGKQHPMAFICLQIAELSDTRVLAATLNDYVFFGLDADIQYANWLYDMIRNSMENAATAYKMGADYHGAINSGMKGEDIMFSFKHGFRIAINKILYKMIEEKKVKGNALIVLKQDIIQRFFDENIGNVKPSKAVAIRTNHLEVTEQGFIEGGKVKLRQTVETPIAGYIGG